MNVQQIIDSMITLSPDADVISADLERETFLLYINLVYQEIYSETVFNNGLAYIRERIVPSEWTDIIELSRAAVSIKQIYLPYYNSRPNRGILLPLTYFDAMRFDPDLIEVGEPTHYHFRRNIITLYPKPYESIILSATVHYAPDFEPLTLNSPESSIPFPSMFHRVIADGAIHYMVLGMGGFKDDRSKLQSEKRWLEGKDQIINYVIHTSGELKYINSYSGF